MTDILEQEFFAPASTDMVDAVIGCYREELAKIERVCNFLHGDGLSSVVHYFMDGNRDSRDRFTMSVDKLFNRDGAVAALNAYYWSHVMQMTDVLDCMPAKRREEWHEQIQKMTTPDFEEQTVRATLGELLALRGKFLAERVDGIFQALSRTHVTNQPEGFGKRMILTGVTNDWGSYARSQTGHINDLRSVIAKFMGRDEPDWNASNRLVEIARAHHRGEWIDVDGGALRIRCYLNGNAHLEVHSEIAWKLNQVLAMLYPTAIPSQFRTAPKRKVKKEYTLMDRPLPFAVLQMLHSMKRVRTNTIRGYDGENKPPVTRNRDSLEFDYGQKDKHVMAEVEKVLTAIGGIRCQGDHYSPWYEFDYDPDPVIKTIVVSGCVPDHKSHQYYPTPRGLAARVLELASIGDTDTCLEPSAGTGALADLLPKERTTCIEVSPLHASVLTQKGHTVREDDFLTFAENHKGKFDRIVMNPPFSQGRWKAHVEAAAGLLSPGGKLAAVIPSSAHGKFHVEGLNVVYDGPHDNQFSGTSTSVTILVGEKP